MKHFLERTDHRHQRQRGLYQHALVPSAAWAQLEIAGDPAGRIEAGIGQDDAGALQGLYQGQKSLVMDIGRVPRPGDHLAGIIDQPTQLHPNDPAPVGLAFLADLVWAASFPDGVDQLNPITVDDGEECRVGQKPVAPALMSGQQALQASTDGQAAKQAGIVALQPAVECSKVAPLEGKQQAHGHQFARPQSRLGMFRDVRHLIVHYAEQADDKILGSHGVLLSLRSGQPEV